MDFNKVWVTQPLFVSGWGVFKPKPGGTTTRKVENARLMLAFALQDTVLLLQVRFFWLNKT